MATRDTKVGAHAAITDIATISQNSEVVGCAGAKVGNSQEMFDPQPMAVNQLEKPFDGYVCCCWQKY